MGRLDEIQKTINSGLTGSNHIKVVPRGLPYFIDPLLRGTPRFARRTGNSTSVLNPDNTMLANNQIDAGSDKIEIRRNNEWLELDSIISLNRGQELRYLEDYNENLLILDANIRTNLSEGDPILLHSVPMKLLFNVTNGDTTIQVISKYQIANGDVFGYLQSPGLIDSITEVEVSEAQFGGTSTDPLFPYVYVLSLESEIKSSISTDQLVYLRAYPGYFSTEIRVPSPLNSVNQMGPFLVDLYGGKLVEGFNDKETLAVKFTNRRGLHLRGSEFSYDTITKNFPVFDRSIRSHSFVTFTLDEGQVRFTGNRCVFQSDTNKLRIGQELIPSIPADGQEYRFSTDSDVDGELRVILSPYAEQVIPINPGVQNHVFSFPSGPESINHIEVNFLSESDGFDLRMTDWNPITAVQNIEYSLVIQTTGFSQYQTTGLVLKPYFQTTDLMKLVYDSGNNYNSGFLYF